MGSTSLKQGALKETVMATWGDVVAHIRANYRIADEDEHAGVVRMVFSTEGERTHVVYVHRQEKKPGEHVWAEIRSPIGPAVDIDVLQLLDRASEYMFGGLITKGDLIWFRHSVPLENFDANELEEPLEMLVTIADRLEEEFTGADEY